MHREIDAAFSERVFDLLGEHALGADLRESNVENLVARGLDDLQLDFDGRARAASAEIWLACHRAS